MANVKILHNKPSDAGTFSGGSWLSTLPLANLVTKQVSRVARSTNAVATSTKFVVDMGRPFSISQMILIGHNLSSSATIRWRMSDSSGGSPALYDATTPAQTPTIPFGSLPWGAMPWDGIDPTIYPGGRINIHNMPDPVYARYILIDIVDASNADGYVQIGRFIAGDPWSPRVNMNWDPQVGYVDDSKAMRSYGGQLYVSEQRRRRQMSLQFDWLSENEAMAAMNIMLRLGIGGDVFITYDADDGDATLFQRSFYASLVKLDPTIHRFVDLYRWSLSVEELI